MMKILMKNETRNQEHTCFLTGQKFKSLRFGFYLPGGQPIDPGVALCKDFEIDKNFKLPDFITNRHDLGHWLAANGISRNYVNGYNKLYRELGENLADPNMYGEHLEFDRDGELIIKTTT